MIRAALHRIEAALGAFAALVLALLLALVLANVVLRYGFGTGLVGTEDLAVWLQVALIGLGAPLAFGGALAMRLDVVANALPQGSRAAAGGLADVFTLVAGLVLVSGSFGIGERLGGISPTLGAPEWIRFGFLGVGGGLVLIVLVLRRIGEGKVLSLLVSLVLAAALLSAARLLEIETPLPPSLVLALIAALGILAGAPLPHAFLAAAALAIPFGSTVGEPAIVSATVSGMSKFLLLAIPFFLLSGGLLTVSGVASRLVAFASSLIGHRRAGLAQTALLTGVLFSGASGSSVANAAFGAATFQPELVRHGYPPAQAGAIVAATSVLDNIIPPSIAFLILAAATSLPVGPLLVGGLAAGGVMAVCLSIAIRLTVREEVPQPRATARERGRAAISALPAFGLGIIVVAGIRFGVVTTTEAAALAAAYTLVLALFAGLATGSVVSVFRQAATEAAAIGLLIGSAGPFATLLALDDMAGLVAEAVTFLGAGAIGVLLLSNLLLLAMGLVLDIGAAILLLGPILLPAAVAAGIDPVQFGVILVVNLMIHGLTPPLGMLIFVVSGVTHVPPAALFRAVVPYLLALLTALALLCAFAILTATHGPRP